jgi:hypothetical protein
MRMRTAHQRDVGRIWKLDVRNIRSGAAQKPLVFAPQDALADHASLLL